MVVTLVLTGVPKYVTLEYLAEKLDEFLDSDEVASFSVRDLPYNRKGRRQVALDFKNGFSAMAAQDILSGLQYQLPEDETQYVLSAKVTRDPDLMPSPETSRRLLTPQPSNRELVAYGDPPSSRQLLTPQASTYNRELVAYQSVAYDEPRTSYQDELDNFLEVQKQLHIVKRKTKLEEAKMRLKKAKRKLKKAKMKLKMAKQKREKSNTVSSDSDSTGTSLSSSTTTSRSSSRRRAAKRRRANVRSSQKRSASSESAERVKKRRPISPSSIGYRRSRSKENYSKSASITKAVVPYLSSNYDEPLLITIPNPNACKRKSSDKTSLKACETAHNYEKERREREKETKRRNEHSRERDSGHSGDVSDRDRRQKSSSRSDTDCRDSFERVCKEVQKLSKKYDKIRQDKSNKKSRRSTPQAVKPSTSRSSTRRSPQRSPCHHSRQRSRSRCDSRHRHYTRTPPPPKISPSNSQSRKRSRSPHSRHRHRELDDRYRHERHELRGRDVRRREDLSKDRRRERNYSRSQSPSRQDRVSSRISRRTSNPGHESSHYNSSVVYVSRGLHSQRSLPAATVTELRADTPTHPHDWGELRAQQWNQVPTEAEEGPETSPIRRITVELNIKKRRERKEDNVNKQSIDELQQELQQEIQKSMAETFPIQQQDLNKTEQKKTKQMPKPIMLDKDGCIKKEIDNEEESRSDLNTQTDTNKKKEEMPKPIVLDSDGNIKKEPDDPEVEKRSISELNRELKRIPSRPRFVKPVMKIIREIKPYVKLDDKEKKDKFMGLIRKILRLRIKNVLSGITTILTTQEILELYKERYDGEEYDILVENMLDHMAKGKFDNYEPSDEEERPERPDVDDVFLPFIPCKKRKNNENNKNVGLAIKSSPKDDELYILEENFDIINISESEDEPTITQASDDNLHKCKRENLTASTTDPIIKKEPMDADDTNNKDKTLTNKDNLNIRVKEEMNVSLVAKETVNTHKSNMTAINDNTNVNTRYNEQDVIVIKSENNDPPSTAKLCENTSKKPRKDRKGTVEPRNNENLEEGLLQRFIVKSENIITNPPSTEKSVNSTIKKSHNDGKCNKDPRNNENLEEGLRQRIVVKSETIVNNPPTTKNTIDNTSKKSHNDGKCNKEPRNSENLEDGLLQRIVVKCEKIVNNPPATEKPIGKTSKNSHNDRKSSKKLPDNENNSLGQRLVVKSENLVNDLPTIETPKQNTSKEKHNDGKKINSKATKELPNTDNLEREPLQNVVKEEIEEKEESVELIKDYVDIVTKVTSKNTHNSSKEINSKTTKKLPNNENLEQDMLPNVIKEEIEEKEESLELIKDYVDIVTTVINVD